MLCVFSNTGLDSTCVEVQHQRVQRCFHRSSGFLYFGFVVMFLFLLWRRSVHRLHSLMHTGAAACAHTRVPPRVHKPLSLLKKTTTTLWPRERGKAGYFPEKWRRRLTSFAQVLTHPGTPDTSSRTESRQTVCHGDPPPRFLWWGRWAAARDRVAPLKLIMCRLLSHWSRNETRAAPYRRRLLPLDTAGGRQEDREKEHRH